MPDTTQPLIALLSPGAMGSAVAARLTAHGARVITSLDGRSARSADRAVAAGMTAVSDDELAGAQLILSIVPPGEAEALARRLLPGVEAAARKPLFIDANALNPTTKRSIAALFEPTGARMIDGSIIGPPPALGRPGTTLYLSGPTAPEAAWLGDFGLDVRILAGAVGAAAALKMCFAGINKGMVGLATAMLLAAERSGAGEALRAQLGESMPQMLERFRGQIPDMFPKAYRWVSEMREISSFLDEDPAAAAIFEGMAQLYQRMAADVAGDREEAATLERALTPSGVDRAAE
jgi:3-hydroxyisobutyrate dehydrogenase-like beta-hydroxyacid dehydrogenase